MSDSPSRKDTISLSSQLEAYCLQEPACFNQQKGIARQVHTTKWRIDIIPLSIAVHTLFTIQNQVQNVKLDLLAGMRDINDKATIITIRVIRRSNARNVVTTRQRPLYLGPQGKQEGILEG